MYGSYGLCLSTQLQERGKTQVSVGYGVSSLYNLSSSDQWSTEAIWKTIQAVKEKEVCPQCRWEGVWSIIT